MCQGKRHDAQGAEGMHLYYCAHLYRAYATHSAVLEQLRGMPNAAKYGHR